LRVLSSAAQDATVDNDEEDDLDEDLDSGEEDDSDDDGHDDDDEDADDEGDDEYMKRLTRESARMKAPPPSPLCTPWLLTCAPRVPGPLESIIAWRHMHPPLQTLALTCDQKFPVRSDQVDMSFQRSRQLGDDCLVVRLRNRRSCALFWRACTPLKGAECSCG
jgi:hypothetical protein